MCAFQNFLSRIHTSTNTNRYTHEQKQTNQTPKGRREMESNVVGVLIYSDVADWISRSYNTCVLKWTNYVCIFVFRSNNIYSCMYVCMRAKCLWIIWSKYTWNIKCSKANESQSVRSNWKCDSASAFLINDKNFLAKTTESEHNQYFHHVLIISFDNCHLHSTFSPNIEISIGMNRVN